MLIQEKDKQVIIIPDVHGRSFWREVVEREPKGFFVFLGDYLDPYPYEGITEEDAFEGLKDIIKFKEENEERVTLLWGNHDLHYLYPELMGSRYDIEHAERNAHFFWDHQTLFKMAYETCAGGERFLFSHAGIGKQWLLSNFPFLKEEEITAELFNDLVGYPPFMSSLGDYSMYRGGDKEYGSMIWADVNEHCEQKNLLPGIVQIFGHTQMEGPFHFNDQAYCLDCRQAFILESEDGTIHDMEGNKLR